MGKPYSIYIDDQLPTLPDGKYLGAQPTADGAVWPMILEKAYAKMFVNYTQLGYGWAYEAIRTLSNKPFWQNSTNFN